MFPTVDTRNRATRVRRRVRRGLRSLPWEWRFRRSPLSIHRTCCSWTPSGRCTLRAALEEANALPSEVPARISFARAMTIDVPDGEPLPAIAHDNIYLGGRVGSLHGYGLSALSPTVGRVGSALGHALGALRRTVGSAAAPHQMPASPPIVIQGLPHSTSPTIESAGVVIDGAVGSVVEGLTIRRFAYGVAVTSGASGTRIGSDLDGTADFAEANLIAEDIGGLRIDGASSASTIRFNSIRDNFRHGIWLVTSKDGSHTITRNLITGNGRAAISVAALAMELPAPVIEWIDRSGSVAGTGCPGCIVEVFADPVDQAARYVDGGTVEVGPDGRWSITGVFLGGPADVSITATQRDRFGSTSRLSGPVPVDRLGTWRLISVTGASPSAIGVRRTLVKRYKLVDRFGFPVPDATVTFKPFGDRLRFDSGPGGVFEVVLPVDFASEFFGGHVSASIAGIERRSGERHSVSWLPRLGVGVGFGPSEEEPGLGAMVVDLSALTADGIGARLLRHRTHGADSLRTEELAAESLAGPAERELDSSIESARRARDASTVTAELAVDSSAGPAVDDGAEPYGAAFLGALTELIEGPFAWQEAMARGGGIYEFVSPYSMFTGTLEIIAPAMAYRSGMPASACSDAAIGATIAGWGDDEASWTPVPGVTTYAPAAGASNFLANAEVIVPSSDGETPESATSFTVGYDVFAPTITVLVAPGTTLTRLPSVLARVTDDAAGVRASSGVSVSLGGHSVAFEFDPASGEIVVPGAARDLPSFLPIGPALLVIRAEDGFCNASEISVRLVVAHTAAETGVVYLPFAAK